MENEAVNAAMESAKEALEARSKEVVPEPKIETPHELAAHKSVESWIDDKLTGGLGGRTI